MPQVVLLILDGFGLAPKNRANPRSRAHTPTFDRLEREAFSLSLQASGVSIGLPWGEPGNSEAGHSTIGAGRVLYHHLPRIVVAIRDQSFFSNPALKGAFEHVKKTGGKVHVMGLVSSGSVHAYIDHLYALFELAQRESAKIALHVFTDGRDAEPHEAGKFLPQIEERMTSLHVGSIASLCGRTIAMDRDGHWEKTEQYYRLLVNGEGERAPSVEEALSRAYNGGLNDAVTPPTVIEKSAAQVCSGDALIFFNFREDSARQLAEAFGSPNFAHFSRSELTNFYFATMTEYAPSIPSKVAFAPIEAREVLGEVLSKAGLSQLRIAETEKYAHVTYFFNGGVETPFPGEDRQLLPSLSDTSPDRTPEMRAPDITAAVLKAMDERTHDVVIANFANGDMVGHTGNFPACVKAIEVVDASLERLVRAVEGKDVTVLITADHGNVEEKINLLTGRPLTEHSLNPVPFFAVGSGAPPSRGPLQPLAEPQGILTDIAPTILALLKIPKPSIMTGQDLFQEEK